MTRPRKEQHQPEVARRDWVVAAVALVGLVIAGYLAGVKLAGGSALYCTAGSGCDVVQASRYSTFLWIPTAAWGAALYLAIAVLAVAGLTSRRWLAAFLLAAGGAGFSLYLTYLELLVIGAVCAYCVASQLVVLALVAVLLVRRPEARGRRSPLRPPRLAALGGAAAIGAVVVGAFVYAAGPAAPPDYQEALARHLASAGAVMYGAYW